MSNRLAPPCRTILRVAAAEMPTSPMAAALVQAGLVAVLPNPSEVAAEVTALPVEELADRQAAAGQQLDQLRREIAASAAYLDEMLVEHDRLRAALAERRSLVARARRQVAAARQTEGQTITAGQRAQARRLLAEAVALQVRATAALAAMQQPLDALLSAPGVAEALAARRAGNQRRAERALRGIWSLARHQPAHALTCLRDLDQAGLAPATRRALLAAIAVAERASARRAMTP